MAFDAFVQISGIEGESTDEKHLEWIEIIRFGVGVKQTVSNTASSCGGACAERADFEDFIFRKLLDKASPKLAQACAAGTHINSKEWEVLAKAIMAVPIVARRKAFDIAADERRKHELDNKRELEQFWKGICYAFA
jgi:hypothetical protein